MADDQAQFDLALRLDIMAGMIQMGEKIAFGSDSTIMREAAAEITALRQGVRQIGDQWTKCQDHIAAQDILIREQAAEIQRLKAS